MLTTDGIKGSPLPPEAPETRNESPDTGENRDEEILALARETLEQIQAVATGMESRKKPEYRERDEKTERLKARLGELERLHRTISVEITAEALRARKRFESAVSKAEVTPDEVMDDGNSIGTHIQTLKQLEDDVLHKIFVVDKELRESGGQNDSLKALFEGLSTHARERETDLTILHALEAQGEKLKLLAGRLVDIVKTGANFGAEWAERHAAEYEPLYAERDRLHEIAKHAGHLEDSYGDHCWDMEGKWPLDQSKFPNRKFMELNINDGGFERWIRSWLSMVKTTLGNQFPMVLSVRSKRLRAIMREKKSFISLAAQLDTIQARYKEDEKVASTDWEGQLHELEIMLREIIDNIDPALSAKGLHPPREKTLEVTKQAIGAHMNVAGGENFQLIYDWRRNRVLDDIRRRLNENPPSADTLHIAEQLHNALGFLVPATKPSHEPAATAGGLEDTGGYSLQP